MANLAPVAPAAASTTSTCGPALPALWAALGPWPPTSTAAWRSARHPLRSLSETTAAAATASSDRSNGSDDSTIGAILASGSASNDDNDGSNSGVITGAVISTLGVAAIIAAILYVRQQGPKTTWLEDGNQCHDPNADAFVAQNSRTVLKPDGNDVGIIQLAADGKSIRLESVNRSNPLYRNSAAPGAVSVGALPHVAMPCPV